MEISGTPVLLVFFGSGFGGVARYLMATSLNERFSASIPYGTLSVNLLGSFLAAALLTMGASVGLDSPTARLLLLTGFLGGFTTYSAFNAEALGLLESGGAWVASGYVAATLLGCLAAGTAGLWLGRAIIGE